MKDKIMKDKIMEVETYFRTKLLAGDFEIIEIDEFATKVLIDACYHFSIWTGNMNIPATAKITKSGSSYMCFELTDDEAKILNRQLTPIVQKHLNTVLFEKKQQELEVLRKKLEI